MQRFFIFYQDMLVIFQKRSITKRFYNWLLNFSKDKSRHNNTENDFKMSLYSF